jgi:hypothetical protein
MQVFRSLVVELALMESSYLAVSFFIEIHASVLVLVKVLIPCAPVVGVLFLILDLQKISSERVMLEMLLIAGFLLWCRLPLFFPQ